jgi:hypothetical protein
MIQATIYLICAVHCAGDARKVIPLEVPRLTCAQSAEQAIALAWPEYRILRVECQ